MSREKQFVGLGEALDLVRKTILPLGEEVVSLEVAEGRILAGDVKARVDSPTHDVSLKDGYAVISKDTSNASAAEPVPLILVGNAYAGTFFKGILKPGTAAKVLTGAPVPAESDAVVAEEFAEMATPDAIRIKKKIDHGLDILKKGSDIRKGETILRRGECLLPGRVGILAAAGYDSVQVHSQPKIAILGTGDEVVAPGRKLQPGQLYASNLVTLTAWLKRFGLMSVTAVVPDNREAIKETVLKFLENEDALLTSGGLWGSERDHIMTILDEIGWKKIFHRVRLGPGKGVAFGFCQDKPVFCLPGGPPSNEMAFLQLALPGLLRLAGDYREPFVTVPARMTCDFRGRDSSWSQFEHATLGRSTGGELTVTPHKPASRLSSIARTTCLLPVMEGDLCFKKNDLVEVQILASLSETLKYKE